MTNSTQSFRSLLSVTLLLVGGYAVAQPAVDQSSPVDVGTLNSTWAIGGSSSQYLFQSVTPSVNGRLRELRLPIGGCSTGTLNLGIFQADPATGLPASGTPALFTRSYPTSDFEPVVTGALQTLLLSPRVGVTAGEPIVFVLAMNDPESCGIVRSTVGDSYPDGTAHFQDDTTLRRILPLDDGTSSGMDDLPFELITIRTGRR